MSGFGHLKSQYIKHLQGLAAPDKAWFIEAGVPAPILDIWAQRFFKLERPTAEEALKQLRLVNHFSLGADPEFALWDGRSLVSAEDRGLAAGLAFGADNNGRLVELRPAPSRFALEVLASIYVELQWLAHLYPTVSSLKWLTGAWSGHDGLGGHIHFGRKQKKLLDKEVDALDRVTKLMKVSEMFDLDQWDLRLQNTAYGRFSDWRPQKHGYEYRTLPSYLGHIYLAYLCLVLGKLAVYSPSSIPQTIQNDTGANARKTIKALLAAFKDLDDDARIAYAGVSCWGLNALGSSRDFRIHWGLTPAKVDVASLTKLNELLLPTSISAPREVVADLYNYIVFNKTLPKFKCDQPTWPYHNWTQGFIPLQPYTKTRVSPGLGEMVWNLMTPTAFPVQILYGNVEALWVGVNKSLWRKVTPHIRELKNRFPEYRIEYWHGAGTQPPFTGSIGLSRTALNVSHHTRTRELIESGIFPLYRFGDEGKYDAVKWEAKDKEEVAKEKLVRSEILF